MNTKAGSAHQAELRSSRLGVAATAAAAGGVLRYLRTGDVLVVWRLDRLGRGLKHLLDLIEELAERRVGFRSLTEAICTTTPAGRLQMHLFGALAEFERELIRERTRAGLAAARRRGRLRTPTGAHAGEARRCASDACQ
jgi:DNA invertase Pin-like site-specific DNA recombinase